jgi:hypothetical protein
MKELVLRTKIPKGEVVLLADPPPPSSSRRATLHTQIEIHFKATSDSGKMNDPFDFSCHETFVPCKGVVTVKWISDDPEFYRGEEDLFDFQKHGIPANFGKKEKLTTEQVNFNDLLMMLIVLS